MIYRVRSYDITASVRGVINQQFTEWMNKAVKYVNEKWPEVEAQHLRQLFQSGKHSFITKHESVEASIEWYKSLFADEGAQKLTDELSTMAEKNGVPAMQSFVDAFYEISE